MATTLVGAAGAHSTNSKVDQGCALVTGASRGIGAAVARTLAGDGWHVGVNYRTDRSGAEALAAEIRRAGGSAGPIEADVTDVGQVDSLFAHLEASHGPVLVLVNNAGTRADQLFPTMGEEDWLDLIETNLTAVYRTMRRAVMSMVRARFGRIVNISSIIGQRSLPGQANYAAAKAGLDGLTRNVAIEVARRWIPVYAVAPGLVDTDLTRDLEQLKQAATRAIIPARRAGTPAEVAACVRFLASDEASYITGSTLTVDGGLAASLFPLPRGQG